MDNLLKGTQEFFEQIFPGLNSNFYKDSNDNDTTENSVEVCCNNIYENIRFLLGKMKLDKENKKN